MRGVKIFFIYRMRPCRFNIVKGASRTRAKHDWLIASNQVTKFGYKGIIYILKGKWNNIIIIIIIITLTMYNNNVQGCI